MITKLRGFLLGGPRNLLDPHIHRHLALIAFFAWIGLGSDGLSSSSYGPEEIFRQLGEHRFLAVGLALAVVATVFLISASYHQIIEEFPSGGGGYLVATKLLGPYAGVVSGGALVVDYVLTIAISIASGCQAIASFLPPSWQPWVHPAEFLVLAALTTLNLRGVKESVIVLTPIFLAFVVSHAGLIVWGVLAHGARLGTVLGDAVRDTHQAASSLGIGGLVFVCLRAFSLGGGTFTGIEAVSNGVGILAEPRVRSGKRTMDYMAASLAFTAGGILLCYLLNDVRFEAGRTLNASLWSRLTDGWHLGPLALGPAVVAITLISEGALLFVAAQTGFVDGPRTLAAMATDEWVPKRFSHLSERLVTQNGVLSMALAAAAVLVYTRGAMDLLIVMYSINVFLTFTLSQIGMARHWIASPGVPRRGRRLLVNVVGTLTTATVLVVTATIKFREGGWITLLATGLLIVACLAIRAHYRRVRRHLASLDRALGDLPLPPPRRVPALATGGPTAIVLVEDWDGLGLHTLFSIQRLFPNHYRNFVFVSVGLVDSAQFKGAAEMTRLEERVRTGAARYAALAERFGHYAEYRVAIGTDLVTELERVCRTLVREFRRPVVFAGQLVFQRESLLTRPLHHDTAFAIQRRLQFHGVQVIVLPIRVWEPRRGEAAAVAAARLTEPGGPADSLSFPVGA